MKIVFILPTYNDEENLKLISKIKEIFKNSKMNEFFDYQ